MKKSLLLYTCLSFAGYSCHCKNASFHKDLIIAVAKQQFVYMWGENLPIFVTIKSQQLAGKWKSNNYGNNLSICIILQRLVVICDRLIFVLNMVFASRTWQLRAQIKMEWSQAILSSAMRKSHVSYSLCLYTWLKFTWLLRKTAAMETVNNCR